MWVSAQKPLMMVIVITMQIQHVKKFDDYFRTKSQHRTPKEEKKVNRLCIIFMPTHNNKVMHAINSNSAKKCIYYLAIWQIKWVYPMSRIIRIF